MRQDGPACLCDNNSKAEKFPVCFQFLKAVLNDAMSENRTHFASASWLGQTRTEDPPVHS